MVKKTILKGSVTPLFKYLIKFMTLEEKVLQLKDLILKHKNAVVFTGAGISTDSGIPDYRSPGSGLGINMIHPLFLFLAFLEIRHNIMTMPSEMHPIRARLCQINPTCSLQNLKKKAL